MDVEQEEMQFLGLFGIYRESFKMMFSWRRIFSQITLTLVFPLTFIILAHIQVSNVIFKNIVHNEVDLEGTQPGTSQYNKLSDLVSSEVTYFWLFKAVYLTFVLIFALLSTAAIVYTIACIYTGQEITFKKIMSVVPRVWKRLMVTFLCIFASYFAYNVASIFVILIWVIVMSFAWSANANASAEAVYVSALVFIGVYVLGLLCLAIIWQLASVISVLEDVSGFKAMMKSKQLLKGKMLTATILFILVSVPATAVQSGFNKFVVNGDSSSLASRAFYGVICLLLLFNLILLGHVVTTVFYFVCKSYHHENIDKSALSDHLQVYLLAEYIPLKSKDLQLEQFHV